MSTTSLSISYVKCLKSLFMFSTVFIGLFLYQPHHYGHIPTAVLSGLTLYMGVVATFGVQFFKRVELLFMAPSQHPYIEYLVDVSSLQIVKLLIYNVPGPVTSSR